MNDIANQMDQRDDRVREHSPRSVNERIALMTQARAERSVRRGREDIVRRLSEIDHEWDIDRVLMANFAVAGGAALGLSRLRARRFGRTGNGPLALLAAQLGFLMLHATVGWCPPMALWRRLGVRSRGEIETERSFLVEALAEARRVDAAQRLPPSAREAASKDTPLNQ